MSPRRDQSENRARSWSKAVSAHITATSRGEASGYRRTAAYPSGRPSPRAGATEGAIEATSRSLTALSQGHRQTISAFQRARATVLSSGKKTSPKRPAPGVGHHDTGQIILFEGAVPGTAEHRHAGGADPGGLGCRPPFHQPAPRPRDQPKPPRRHGLLPRARPVRRQSAHARTTVPPTIQFRRRLRRKHRGPRPASRSDGRGLEAAGTGRRGR